MSDTPENPYAPPKAVVEQLEPAGDIPADVMKRIRQGWMAGLCSTSLTAVLTILAVSGIGGTGFSAWAFIDVVLMLGLTLGIYRKSRICAVLLFLYFLGNRIVQWMDGGIVGVPLALIFLWLFGQAVYGTIQYHQLKVGR